MFQKAAPGSHTSFDLDLADECVPIVAVSFTVDFADSAAVALFVGNWRTVLVVLTYA